MDLEQLIDAWRANCAINYELLALCTDDSFELKPGKGKTVRSGFVHIVGVRRSHLEERMKSEAESVPRLDWRTASRKEIQDALGITDALFEKALRQQEETGRPARWTTARFFAYSVAHEAHHRSQIEMAMRLNGHEPDDAALYGLWDWPKKAL